MSEQEYVTVEMRLPKPPDDLEYTGEWRPSNGDPCMMRAGLKLDDHSVNSYPILRRKPLTGQAWLDAQEPGTVFRHKDTLFSVLRLLCKSNRAYRVRDDWRSDCDEFSDDTCHIEYKPSRDSRATE